MNIEGYAGKDGKKVGRKSSDFPSYTALSSNPSQHSDNSVHTVLCFEFSLHEVKNYHNCCRVCLA